MKILITGVAGLLGSNFARYLLDKGNEVIGIDDLSGGYQDFVDSRVDLHIQNLKDMENVDAIFDLEKPDVVYHFGAYASEGLSPFIRNFNYTNNILCSVNVINACIKYNVKKIIFTSSMAVYGEGKVPFKESAIPSPVDPYGIAKFAIEMDFQEALRHFGLSYTIVRPHNVIGINQNIWDRYRNVIGIWINNILNNKSMLIYGDGEQKRAFSDIKYYMKPFEKLATEYENEIFNLGADKKFTIKQTAETLKEIGIELGYNSIIEYAEKRDEVKFAYSDHTKAKNLLSFVDNTVLKDIIKKMFVWAMHQPQRKVKKMNYEITKNMYGYWK